MTADFAALPVEVQAIVNALAAGPTTLLDHKQTAITAAFDYGVIEASAQVGQGYTRYRLRARRGVA